LCNQQEAFTKNTIFSIPKHWSKRRKSLFAKFPKSCDFAFCVCS